MYYRRIISSTKTYIAVLIVAIGFLLLFSSISYRQISAMKRSAELVSESLMVDKEINKLFSYFSLIEAAKYKSLILNDSTFINTYLEYNQHSKSSLLQLSKLSKDFPEQRQYLDSINQWKDSLDISMNKLNKYQKQLVIEKKVRTEIDKMTAIQQTINSYKVRMSKNKDVLFEKRIAAYKTDTIFTPFFSLLSVFFSLIMFGLAFRKINNDRKRLINTQSFVENIISNSDNTITYLEPIRDDNNRIIDFRIDYVNNKIEDNIGKTSENVIGKRISEVFPSLFANGVFEIYVTCVTTGESQNYKRSYLFNNEEKWFRSIASKLNTGVNITTINITKERQRTEDLKKLTGNLFEKNAILSNAETIAKIGSYSWYPDTDTYELSDNFYRLLGVEPNEFESGFENFKTFIHPDDQVKYQKTGIEGLKSRQIKEYIYRVITKKGKIRYWRTAGEIIIESGNEKMVGVVQDVTDSIGKDLELKKRNKALKRSNAELESFNRVVSHDLQEPLRKIQTFISLLTEAEADSLSDNSKNYFNKINNAASRMQLLIKNLLSYSRIDSTHENFEIIDLNKKLEKVEDNFSARIIEAKITIIKKNLPTIQGIPFQMEQLFNNLLSNAIKYRNLTKDAKILIDASIVHKNQIALPNKKTSKNYYKIVFSDNGIGFDQENAEKIFNIFERLHQQSAYSGTGIGLAICKKIVENHNGFIYATSELQKGSIFYIYLPA